MENKSHNAQEIDKYYNSISKEELIERFEMFSKLPYKNMCISEIQEFLKKVFLWSSPAILPVSTSQMGSRVAKLYRIRNIEHCKKSELIDSHKSEQMIGDTSSNQVVEFITF